MYSNIIYGPQYIYEGVPFSLYVGSKASRGFYQEIMDKGLAVLSDYRRKHNKVFFFTLTLTFPMDFPQYDINNNLMNQFCGMLMQSLARMSLDPAYLWVREKDTSYHHHYHLALWLNGSLIQHPQHVSQCAESLWLRLVGEAKGCVDYQSALHYATMIRRGDITENDNCLRVCQSLSYLAKVYSKELELPYKIRHYSCSQAKMEANIFNQGMGCF